LRKKYPILTAPNILVRAYLLISPARSY
jgi:hypothetical protein